VVSAPAARHPGELRWETRLLTVVTVTMVVFGIANTYGALSLQTAGGGGAGFALRQFVGAMLGLLGLSVVSRVDYHLWRRLAWPLFFATILLLLIPILPGTERIAPRIHGARRWVDIGPLNFQPSEIARLAIIVWCAALAAKKGVQVREFKKGVLPFLVGIGTVALLILGQPNLSMAILVTLLGLIVLFSAGAKIGHFILLGLGGLLLLFEKIQSAQYRVARLTTFLNPGEATAAAGMQIHQSLVGIGSGRVLGVGFGEGQQKLFLPFAYSDFIFSTIGEEWGFLGIVLVVVLFGLFLWLGMRIARSAPDPLGQFLAVGITAMIGITAVMHMAVSLALMPTTGLTLPFMSYGRSSLVISLVATGILINIGRMRGRPARKAAAE
jgi:cell division protein FtsW